MFRTPQHAEGLRKLLRHTADVAREGDVARYGVPRLEQHSVWRMVVSIKLFSLLYPMHPDEGEGSVGA